MLRLLLLLLTFTAMPNLAQDKTGATQLADGTVKSPPNGQQVAWDADSKKWVSLKQFWLNFTKREGGLTWERSDTYPDYDKVNEFDTFMVETAEGPCLMQFFHSRWRRANDVQRWDDAFNEYKGCPYVFD